MTFRSGHIPGGVHRVKFPASVLGGCLALSACAPGDVSSDASELGNTWRSNQVPKSSPAALVRTFDRYCIETPASAREATLRTAGYVPLPDNGTQGTQAFVVDDARPAVAFSETMCLVRARARTGQANRFGAYVTDTFPTASSTDPTPLGRTVEQAWTVPGPAVIATERVTDVDWDNYTLIYFRPGGSP